MVSDLETPRLNGLELCQVVKSDQRLNNICFILLSGISEIEARVKGLDTSNADAGIAPENLSRIYDSFFITHEVR